MTKGVGYFWLVLFVWGLSCFSSSVDNFYYSLWYAVEYGVSPSKVTLHDKPTDCDFLHEPMGTKNCHFEKFVTTFNAGGEIIGGRWVSFSDDDAGKLTDAPKYSLDGRTNKPIVSRDNGKSWILLAGNIPDLKVASVWVGWFRERN
jgi:hypothetical protein